MNVKLTTICTFALVAVVYTPEVDASISLGSCSLSCSENEKGANHVIGNNPVERMIGSPGKAGPEGARGPPGPRGEKGVRGVCNCPDYQQVVEEMKTLKAAKEELQRNVFIKDCKEAKKTISTSGVSVIYPFKTTVNGIHVYCNQDIDGGGWIVIQRRVGGPVDFFRGWDEYVKGFGNKEGDFWLGLETIHLLTNNGSYELRVDLEDKAGNRAFAKYSTFKLGGTDQNYKLYSGGYSGNAGDSLVYHQMPFSTKDRDNDSNGNSCASSYVGAWWYNNCHRSNLNGLYGGVASSANGVSWYPWKNTHESLKTTEMKIRKLDA